MKVLFGASVYNHLSTFHKPFMKLFQEQGYEVHAIGSNSMGRKDELIEMGIICHDIDFDRFPFSKKNLNALRNLRDLFDDQYFDLIHVHTPTAAFLTRYAAMSKNRGKFFTQLTVSIFIKVQRKKIGHCFSQLRKWRLNGQMD